MHTELSIYTIEELCEGFVYNELEGKGLYGLAGQLTIQPEYQRHYLYADAGGQKEIDVVDSVVKGYPLGLLYFNRTPSGQLEVLDGQQRITSLGRFLTNRFSYHIGGLPFKFASIKDEDLKQKILHTKLLVYICEGSEMEIKEWFSIINMGGLQLKEQEKLNAIYSGTFVTLAKAEFSNSQNANVQKWKAYVRGDVKRQDILECALRWVSRDHVADYMKEHRNDESIGELSAHFHDVIAWVESVFTVVYREMCGLPWGRLFDTYHHQPYNAKAVAKKVATLMDDPYVSDKRGIFEYVLGGCTDSRLLHVRVFDDATKRQVYRTQTEAARAKGVSNCPLCAVGHTANKTRIYTLREMEADHVTAWSKGGDTNAKNCQMLCTTHNRAKGNR